MLDGTVTPSSAPMVSLRGVGKIYPAGRGAFAALRSIDLDVRAGEVTALKGPSGSGKTTLLSIIGGILRPTEGSVALLGRDIAALDEIDRSRVRLARIGFVFQAYNLFPSLTALQNVEVALDLKGMRGLARRRQAAELLESVGLGEKALSFPADLSGGQKQRIAIARALAGGPSIILADEPTAALDVDNGRRIMRLLRDLAHGENRAVIVVTHDTRMLYLTDRVVTMEDGRIVDDETQQRELAPEASLTADMIRRPGKGGPAGLHGGAS
jgi:putative ABC transport system ATP-binding protein